MYLNMGLFLGQTNNKTTQTAAKVMKTLSIKKLINQDKKSWIFNANTKLLPISCRNSMNSIAIINWYYLSRAL